MLVKILGLPFTHWMVLGKLVNIFESQLSEY